MLRRSCRDITFTNTVINGYWDKFARAAWIRRRTDDNDEEQVDGGIMFNGFTCIDGPLIAFEGNGSDETYWGTLTNYNIHQMRTIPSAANEDPNIGSHWRDSDEKAIDVTSELFQFGPGTIHGYPDDKSMDTLDWPIHVKNDSQRATDETIAVGSTKECFYERIGNLVFACAHLQNISSSDHGGGADTEDLAVTLPFQPVHSTIFTGPCSISNMDLEDGSENACNIVCVAKDDNAHKIGSTQYKGYVKFKITYQGDGDPQADDYLRLDDIDSATNELWFSIWYICQPNAIPNQ